MYYNYVNYNTLWSLQQKKEMLLSDHWRFIILDKYSLGR